MVFCFSRASGIRRVRIARTDTAIDGASRNSFGGQSDWCSLTLVEIGLGHYHHNRSREIEVWNWILFQSGFAQAIGVSLPFQFSDPYIQHVRSSFYHIFIILPIEISLPFFFFFVRQLVKIRLDSSTIVSIEKENCHLLEKAGGKIEGSWRLDKSSLPKRGKKNEILRKLHEISSYSTKQINGWSLGFFFPPLDIDIERRLNGCSRRNLVDSSSGTAVNNFRAWLLFKTWPRYFEEVERNFVVRRNDQNREVSSVLNSASYLLCK